jgi:hypothetical protein
MGQAKSSRLSEIYNSDMRFDRTEWLFSATPDASGIE